MGYLNATYWAQMASMHWKQLFTLQNMEVPAGTWPHSLHQVTLRVTAGWTA